MSRYRSYDTSIAAKLKLKLAGNLMIWTGQLADKTQVMYRQAYLRRHGHPSLGQILDDQERERKDGKL